MRKSNWKRRGLAKPITGQDIVKKAILEELERRIAVLPKELQEAVRKDPSLAAYL